MLKKWQMDVENFSASRKKFQAGAWQSIAVCQLTLSIYIYQYNLKYEKYNGGSCFDFFN
jgi:hypothetical protein